MVNALEPGLHHSAITHHVIHVSYLQGKDGGLNEEEGTSFDGVQSSSKGVS